MKLRLRYYKGLTCLLMLQIFDISPVFGSLLPGKSETITFTFHGHSFTENQVRAYLTKSESVCVNAHCCVDHYD